MNASLLHIHSFMTSFVKSEVDALIAAGVNVRVVMLENPKETSQRAWNYVTGGCGNPIIVCDQSNSFIRWQSFFSDTISLARKGFGYGVMDGYRMAKNGFYSGSLAFYHFRRALQIANAVSHYRLCHIRTHFAWGNAFICAYVSRILRVPFSITVHADDIYGLSMRDQIALKWLLNQCDKVLCASRFNQRFLNDAGLYSNTKSEVIYCGIPLSKFPYIENRDPDAIFRIVTIPSGFVEKKGLHILIAAIEELVRQGIRIECFVIGTDASGRRLNEYKRMVEQKGLSEEVVFLGPVPQNDLAVLYEKCHAFVLPCVVDARGKMDGMPISLMEAMAVGLPVISTTISGIPELIEDGQDGLLAKPGDVAELVIRLRRIIETPGFGETLARNARLRIERDFDIEVVVKRLRKSLSLVP